LCVEYSMTSVAARCRVVLGGCGGGGGGGGRGVNHIN